MIYKKRDADLIISVISKKTGVKLICQGDAWRHDTVKKIIYYPEKSVIDDETLACLIHEASHIRFTVIDSDNLSKIKKIAEESKKKVEQVSLIFSICEDLRIEKKISDIYIGARKILVSGSNQTHDKYIIYRNRLKKNKDFKSLGEIMEKRSDNFCYLFFIQDYISEKRLNLIFDYCTIDVVEAYNKLVRYAHIIKNLDSYADVFDYINANIIQDYLGLCDDTEEKEEEKSKESQGEGDGFGEQKKQDKNDEDKSDEEDKEKEKESECGTGNSDEEEEKEEEKEEESFSGRIGSSNLDLKDDDFYGFDKSGSSDYEKRKFIEYYFNFTSRDFTYEEFLSKSKMLVPSLRKPISIIKDLELKREESGFDSGKVDLRKIHKLRTGFTRIFKRNNDLKLDDKELAIAILVDESGSMGNDDKDIIASISVAAMSTALEIANKKFCVYGFNDYFFFHKNFNKKVSMPEMYRVFENVHKNGAGWNNDGYAIWKTTKELLKRPEKNKIMIVLSDGEPTPGHGLCPDNGRKYEDYDLTNEVKDAEKNGIKIYSIGIQSDYVKRYYRDDMTTVIRDVNELPKVLFDILKKNVGKRIR
jgi:hypothetical protein